jgi:ABC-type multidrug transport system fused ATPase/permease subunit
MWRVLKEISFDEKINQFEEKLNEKISENGSNLSVGEKQLLCLTRSLLMDNKIIIMDEATSNIDINSEKTIQKVINEKLKEKTVILIAHRLETIMNMDKIILINDGEILEIGKPIDLINKKSFFYNLVNESGEENKNHLIGMVKNY